MKIEIRSDIFKSADFKGLNFLIQLCTYKNRYELFVDLAETQDTELYKRLDSDDKEILKANFNVQILQQETVLDTNKATLKVDYSITNRNRNDNEFNIEEGIKFLLQPVSVVLENSLNDSYFIKAILNHFGKTSKLHVYFDNKWFQFENAGGCTNVENFVKGKLESFNGLPKNNFLYLRCFVFLDSDRDHANQEIDYKHKKLVTFLKKNNIDFHIWEKRAMENYMPSEVYKECNEKQHTGWIDAFLNLDERQQDFLKISEGFSKKDNSGKPVTERADLDINVKNLFKGVSDTSYDTLNTGFKIPNFKSDFPLKFLSSPNVHFDTLTNRTKSQDDKDELLNVVKKLENLL